MTIPIWHFLWFSSQIKFCHLSHQARQLSIFPLLNLQLPIKIASFIQKICRNFNSVLFGITWSWSQTKCGSCTVLSKLHSLHYCMCKPTVLFLRLVLRAYEWHSNNFHPLKAPSLSFINADSDYKQHDLTYFHYHYIAFLASDSDSTITW